MQKLHITILQPERGKLLIMKYLRIIFYPMIWLISLPNKVRVLERRIETLSERLEHYETSTDKDFENLAAKIDELDGVLRLVSGKKI